MLQILSIMETVFITGVGSGIGYQVALAFLKNNYHVIGTLRKPDQQQLLQFAAKELPGQLSIINVDLSQSDYLETIATNLKTLQVSKIKALINVAGILNTNPIQKVTSQNIATTMHLNFEVPVMLSQLLMPHLKSQGQANILNITSMSGFQDSVRFPGLSIYGASKAALGSFTQSLSVELSEHNIHVNALAIGSVNTKMLQQAFPDFKSQTSAQSMGTYIYTFATSGYQVYNGKILPVAITNP